MPSKKSNKGFTSIRVIGKKAQEMLKRAKSTMDTQQKKRTRTPLPETEDFEEFVVHISIQSIVKGAFAILAIVIGVWGFYLLRDKIILLLLAVFLAAVIDPSVQALQRMHVPRGIGILIHYFIALFLLFFLFFSFIPIVAEQIQDLARFISAEVNFFLADPQIQLPLVTSEMNFRLTSLLQSVLQTMSINEFADALSQFGQNLSTAAQGSLRYAAQLAGSVLNFFVSLIIVLVLAFFIQIEKEDILSWIRSFMPTGFRKYLDNKSEAIHTKIGQWARGELLLMASIFALTLIALLILDMPYALTLAALAGFCEFIPAVGPFIAAVPAVLIAFTQEGFVMGCIMIGVYYVIQWCENNLLVPLIMKRAVGLSPIAILFAMMVGISFPNTIHPVIGVMLAVPLTTIIALFLEDWRDRRE